MARMGFQARIMDGADQQIPIQKCHRRVGNARRKKRAKRVDARGDVEQRIDRTLWRAQATLSSPLRKINAWPIGTQPLRKWGLKITLLQSNIGEGVAIKGLNERIERLVHDPRETATPREDALIIGLETFDELKIGLHQPDDLSEPDVFGALTER